MSGVYLEYAMIREHRRVIDLDATARGAIVMLVNTMVSRKALEDFPRIVELLSDIIISQVESILEPIIGNAGSGWYTPSLCDAVYEYVDCLSGDEVADYVAIIGKAYSRDAEHSIGKLVDEVVFDQTGGKGSVWEIDNEVVLSEVMYGLCPSDALIRDVAYQILRTFKDDIPNDCDVHSVRIRDRKIILTYSA